MQENHHMTEDERRAEEERREMNASEVGKEFRRPVGESIQRVRESRGLTREQLADAVGTGVTAEDIASYESGDGIMPVPEFIKVARVLEVEPDDLIPRSCLDLPKATPAGYDSLPLQDRQTVENVIAAFLNQQKYRQSI